MVKDSITEMVEEEQARSLAETGYQSSAEATREYMEIDIEAMTEEFRESCGEDLKRDLSSTMLDHVEDDMWKDHAEEMREDIERDSRDEILGDMRERMTEEIREKIQSDMGESIREQVRSEVEDMFDL